MCLRAKWLTDCATTNPIAKSLFVFVCDHTPSECEHTQCYMVTIWPRKMIFCIWSSEALYTYTNIHTKQIVAILSKFGRPSSSSFMRERLCCAVRWFMNFVHRTSRNSYRPEFMYSLYDRVLSRWNYKHQAYTTHIRGFSNHNQIIGIIHFFTQDLNDEPLC